jgi:hypothetical protein
MIAGHRQLTPVLLATQDAEIRKIMVQRQSQANNLQDPILKNPTHTRAGGEDVVITYLCSKYQVLRSNCK